MQTAIHPPRPACGFEELVESLPEPSTAELGWVDVDKLRQHAFPPAPDTRIMYALSALTLCHQTSPPKPPNRVCGLPRVYDDLCGPRGEAAVREGSVLHSLGYTEEHVVKF